MPQNLKLIIIDSLVSFNFAFKVGRIRTSVSSYERSIVSLRLYIQLINKFLLLLIWGIDEATSVEDRILVRNIKKLVLQVIIIKTTNRTNLTELQCTTWGKTQISANINAFLLASTYSSGDKRESPHPPRLKLYMGLVSTSTARFRLNVGSVEVRAFIVNTFSAQQHWQGGWLLFRADNTMMTAAVAQWLKL